MSDLITTGKGARLIAASQSAGEPIVFVHHRPRNMLAELLTRAVAQIKNIRSQPARAGAGAKRSAGMAAHKSGVTYSPNGAREMARRVVQIQAGRLRYENGLMP